MYDMVDFTCAVTICIFRLSLILWCRTNYSVQSLVSRVNMAEHMCRQGPQQQANKHYFDFTNAT